MTELTWHKSRSTSRSPGNVQIASVHPHVYAAVYLGGAILLGPVLLALFQPGQLITRHTIGIGQMAMSGLLIDIGSGQIEMHFQVFGALAFLATASTVARRLYWSCRPTRCRRNRHAKRKP